MARTRSADAGLVCPVLLVVLGAAGTASGAGEEGDAYSRMVAGIIAQVNVFVILGAAFGVVLMGSIFGGAAGMIIGTIVGYFRLKSIDLAPDHEPEGARPYLLGILVPAVILAIAVLFYLSAILKLF